MAFDDKGSGTFASVSLIWIVLSCMTGIATWIQSFETPPSNATAACSARNITTADWLFDGRNFAERHPVPSDAFTKTLAHAIALTKSPRSGELVIHIVGAAWNAEQQVRWWDARQTLLTEYWNVSMVDVFLHVALIGPDLHNHAPLSTNLSGSMRVTIVPAFYTPKVLVQWLGEHAVPDLVLSFNNDDYSCNWRRMLAWTLTHKKPVPVVVMTYESVEANLVAEGVVLPVTGSNDWFDPLDGECFPGHYVPNESSGMLTMPAQNESDIAACINFSRKMGYEAFVVREHVAYFKAHELDGQKAITAGLCHAYMKRLPGATTYIDSQALDKNWFNATSIIQCDHEALDQDAESASWPPVHETVAMLQDPPATVLWQPTINPHWTPEGAFYWLGFVSHLCNQSLPPLLTTFQKDLDGRPLQWLLSQEEEEEDDDDDEVESSNFTAF